MAEDINQDEDDIEEEEEESGADAQQTLDDLTVLTESSDRLDDPEEQTDDGSASEWEEPSASQSLSTIHTGSRPTDAELLSNLIPEGDVIVEEGEIVRTQEEVGEELDDIEPPEVELETPDSEPEEEGPAQQFAAGPPDDEEPEPTAAPEEEEPAPEADQDPDVVQFAEPAAAAVAEPLVTEPPEVTLAPTEEPEPTSTPDPLETTDAVGSEDSAIPLDIDPGSATEITIGNVPDGAILSAGTDNGDGTWTLDAGELEGLTITPPADSDVDFTLEVTAGGETQDLDVTVNAVADAPTASAEDAAGLEDTAIDLDLGTALSDVDGSESLSITISGVPEGATFSAGTDNGDGTWSFDAGDLAGLQITPPADFAGEIPLTLVSTSTEADGGDAAATEVPFTVTVADTVDTVAAVTNEDTAVSLNIDLPDGVTSLTISDVPDGATLSAGTDNGDGTWTLSSTDLESLTITPPADSDVDFTLQVTADGVSQDLDVTVNAVADVPDVSAESTSGTQDTAIPLDLGSALTDTDGSETLSVTISGVPEGAVLSAGTDNGDGSWTLDPADLEGLTITPPAGSTDTMNLSMEATSTDTDSDSGDVSTATNTIDFTVDIAADGTFSVTDSVGNEDSAIALSIDPGAASQVVIGDVPTGATLSAGTDNGDGTWSVNAVDLEGLTITPPADSDVDFTLSVTADGNTTDLDVTVNAVADAPTATAEDVSGTEGDPVALDLGAALSDTDGSETLSITVGNVPEGATLSVGTDNGDGTWTVDPADLANVSITPPAGFFGDIDLTLTSTSTETDGGDTATTTVPFTVSIASDGDFGAAAAVGDEDTGIPLTIDDGGANTITISDVPDGAVLSAGTDNGDGTWSIEPADMEGLTITPPTGFDGSFDLTLTSTATESDPDASVPTASTSAVFTVTVNPDDEEVVFEVTAAEGLEDTAIALNIDPGTAIEVTISDVPNDASLSAGTDNGDGSWTLTAEDLEGLTITPPQDSDADFTLQVTADGESQGLDVNVLAVADRPDLEVQTSAGDEDTAIPLNITSGLVDTDGSETLSISIDIVGIPDGAVLASNGVEIDITEGTATLTPDQLSGLTITPPQDFYGDINLQVTSTATEGGAAEDVAVDTAASTASFGVTVRPVEDNPIVSAQSASGDEDTAIALDLSANMEAGVTEEVASIIIGNVPDGSTFSAGTDNGDGTWTLSVEDLTDLTVTPPQDWNGTQFMTMTAISTDGGVNVTGFTLNVEDTPDLQVSDASGIEDGAIGLDISAGLGESVTVSNVPDGAELSAGTDNGDGTWTIAAEDLDGLTITPPENSDADFTLTVTNGEQTLDVDVTVAADTDAPTVTAADVAGSEDQAINLDLSSTLTDTDGSETLSVTISGVPDGAVLSAGTDNGDGTWSVDPADLAGLQVTPPDDFSGSFDLTVTATSTEADGGDTATTTSTFTVDVAGVADDPTLTVDGASAGTEDQAIALNIDAGVTDDSESLSITISGVPDGAALSAGTDNGDGTWTLSSEDLNGLTVTPPADSDVDFSLSVTATSTDGSDTATTTGTIDVSVAADADTPTLTMTDAAGTEDQAISLDIASGLTDTDGSETLSVSISGIPDGAVLSSGGVEIVVDENGVAQVDPGQLAGLQITPPADSDADFSLSVSATSTDGTDTATTTGTLNVSVAADADAPTLTMTDAAGTEDQAISLDIASGLTDTDGSETLSVSISGIPDGAVLSSGGVEIVVDENGVAQVDPGQLAGLQITPPADSDVDFSLSVSATSTDGTDTATTTGTLNVSVAADADAPTLTLDTSATGTEDTAINLDIASGLTDTDGSESLSVTISGVPDGAALSAGTDNGDGTWTLSADDLAGLQVTPPDDFSGSFDLQVTATSTEADGGDTATTSGTITVDVAGVADDPTLTVDSTAAGIEDTAIALDIDAGVTDGSETLSVTISGVPDGAVLSAGTDNGDGTWTLSGGDLNGLTVTPPENSNEDFSLTVTATSTDGTDTATTTGTIDVAVTGDADAAALSADVGETTTDGTTTTVDIDLDISASLTDTDGSETLSITISGVPDAAELSAGTDNGDGTWSVDPADLEGLQLSVPNDFGQGFQLQVSATTTENDGDTETVTTAIEIGNPDTLADGVDLDVNNVAAGIEDTAIALDIDAGLVDTDGSETLSLTIGNVPDGAVLSAGTDNGDGTWTLEPGDVDGLTITPPADSNEDFQLSVTATATETSTGDTTTATENLNVVVFGDADAPTLDMSDVSGDEDTAIPLTINTGLTDTDGSETLSVTISNIPEGAVLSSGGVEITVENGAATLDPGQLADLAIVPPDNSDGDFSLLVSATATENDGDTNTVSGILEVTVEQGADAPTLDLTDATGTEDQAIGLNIDAGLTDGSETLSVTISGVPDGAALSAGTDNGDGTWTLDPGDLDGLTVTPPADSDADFSLTVTATSTDGTDTATTTGTIDVSVAADADAPTLTLDTSAEGTEDTAIGLDIASGLTDTDGSESLSVTISGVPDGATLNAGTDNGDGTWTLDAGDLDGLQVAPPDDFSGSFDLTVTATATEADGGDTATTSGTITVDVDGDADAATLEVSDAAGTEDTAIALNIDAGVTDDSESLSVTISGVPDGAALSAGTDNGDGTWTLDAGDLDGLTVTPPADSNEDFSLTVTATTTDGDDTATTTGTIDVDVTGDADAASLSVSLGDTETDVSGVTYELDVSAALSDTDGSETLSVTISDVPDGVTLNAGTDNGDGTWTLEPGDLADLEMTVPDGTEAFDLTVAATASEDDGDTSTTTATISVDSADTGAEEAELSASDAAGSEDTAIALDIDASLTDTDGSETLSITISGVPDGAELSAGTDNGDGTWTLDAGDLDGLTVTPPADSNEDFSLTVSATTTETSTGDTATTTTTLDVDVTGVADAPTLEVSVEFSETTGGETGIAVPQSILDSATGDNEITISGVPDGATLSGGTDNGDGTWTLDPADLSDLTVIPESGDTDTMSLSFEVTGEGGAGDSLVSENFDSGVSGWSGDAESAGGELRLEGDATTSKTFDFGPEHAGQTVTISFDADAQNDWEESGTYQDYFEVSANGDQILNTSEESATSYSFEVTLDENGQVTVEMSTDTTASDERVDIDNFQITAGDDWETSLATDSLDVTPDPEGAVYDVDLLDITSALTDTDGSETLSITVGGLPDDATLTAGTDNGDGTWTLEAGDLEGLEMFVPVGSGDFDLSVSATATEDDGDTNTVSTTVTVEERDVEADGATLETTDAAGSEDTAIALDIDATMVDTDGSETMSITISDVPDDATLSAGTDNGDGTWTLEAGDLDGLTVTPGADSNEDFTLSVSVTTTEASSGETATTTATLDVDVTGVADAPTLSASVDYDSQTAGETSVSVPQTISDAADTDGSTVTVSGVPDGATLSAGTDNGDGTWTLDSADLTDLTVTPADGATDDFSLSFDVSGAGGSGDTLFSDNFNDGVSGWGDEAEYYNGFMDGGSMEIEQDETATRTFDFGEEHAGQTVTIEFDSATWGSWDESGSYQDDFVVTANGNNILDTSDSGSNSYSLTATLDENGQLQLSMNVDSTSSSEGMDIDNFQITAGDDWESSLASESVDVSPEPGGFVYDLDITAGLTDTDGSETLSVTVGNMPDGAQLSSGTDNGDGTWTLGAGDLDGLQVTVPTDAGEFDLSVSATATEDDGDTNSVATSVSISTPDVVAEDANLTTSDASGEEDRAIALDIDASLADTDGSETLSITISGVPDGAELSAGTDNGDGSWTLESGDLADLTILPPTDSSDDFSLSVSATTTETASGDTSTVTSTIDVSVAGVADAPELSVDLGDATEVGGGATPVSYWNVDETTGLTMTDSVGDNDAESHGKSSSKDDLDLDDTGVFSTAAEFKSGDRQYMEVDHSPDLKPDEGSLTMWFNADSTSGRRTLASSDSSGNDDGGHFGLFVENGTLRLRMQSTDDQTDFTGGSVSSDEWNQVTVTWGEEGASVYLNGELVASDSDWTEGLAGNENPWTFGANQWSSSDDTADNLRDYFDGHMDDIAIYDQQLSADDVQSLFDDGVQDVMDAGDAESLQYPLDISASLSDTDGSESMSISIEGLPDGAELSAGTDNGDGTWSVDSGDLDGLTLTVPADSDDFAMSVSATVTDEGGDTRTATELVQVDVGGDGFDAGTTGTDSADTLTGSVGDDTISSGDGDDVIDAGDGDDTVMAGDGDDEIDAGDGNDVVDAGAGNDTIEGGAGDDDVMGGQGDDLFIFGAGDGADYFQGGDGWSDTVQIDGVDGGPGDDSGWTLQVDEGAGYTETDSGIEFDAEASGVITLADGSELTFDGVEKLEW